MSTETIIHNRLTNHLETMRWVLDDENLPDDGIGIAVAAIQAMLIAEGMPTTTAMDYGREREQSAETRTGLLLLRDAIDRLLSAGAEQRREKRQ